MKWFHGTNNKEELLARGIYKRTSKINPNMSDCIYLATTKKEAQEHGKDIFEIEYDPLKNPKMNNYNKDSWQIRVYEPIGLRYISKFIKEE